MFDTLDEKVKHDEEESTTPRERYLRYAAVFVLTTLLFGGLYAGVQFLE